MAPVLGTDGRDHVVYELELVNAKPVLATLQEIQVLDADRPSRRVGSFAGADLLQRLRTLTGKTPVDSLEIEPDTARLVLIDLSFARGDRIPRRLIHRFLLTGATITGGDTPGPLDYTAAPFELSGSQPEIGPPLAGKGWVAINGCCGDDGVHRTTVLPVNGTLFDTQRFAIDYMRIDAEGRFVVGDETEVESYVAFGADVLAVADATVVATLDTLPEQDPGSLPDPSTITLETVDGNHVILDLGHGVYAFYAHLQPGSVTVEAGDRVRRGEKLGLLGNTGNSSAPHLHFHLMDGRSVLGSNGLPYTMKRFDLLGVIDPARFAAATSLEGVWNEQLFDSAREQSERYPLDLDVLDFGRGR